MSGVVHVSLVGLVLALGVAMAIGATLWWMLHPPSSYVERLAAEAEVELSRLVGSIIVVFSTEIDSAHMMALAARLARGGKSDLLAAYVIEVPFTLPPNAQMPIEDRAALDALAASETIAMKRGVRFRKETIHARQTSQAVLDLAKREKAQLIVLGSYREGKYTGAPLGRTIETIAANAKCDVLIGVEGKHGSLLVEEQEFATRNAS